MRCQKPSFLCIKNPFKKHDDLAYIHREVADDHSVSFNIHCVYTVKFNSPGLINARYYEIYRKKEMYPWHFSNI